MNIQDQQLLSHKHNDSGHVHPFYDQGTVFSGGYDATLGHNLEYQHYTYKNTENGYANLGNAVAINASIPVTPGAENRPANYTKRIWLRVS